MTPRTPCSTRRCLGLLILVLLVGCGEPTVPYMGGGGGGTPIAPPSAPSQPPPPPAPGGGTPQATSQPVAQPVAPPPPPRLEARPVRIDLPQGSLRKADELVPFTIYSVSSPAPTGTQTVQAPEGAAILCLAETPTGGMPLACISMPSSAPRQAETVLNAESTALASVLALPMVAQETLQELRWAARLVKTRPSFPELVKAVADVLTTADALPQEGQHVSDLRCQVVTEYFSELDRILRERDVSVFGGVAYQATAPVSSPGQSLLVTAPTETGGFAVTSRHVDTGGRHTLQVANPNRRTAIATSPVISGAYEGIQFVDPAVSLLSLEGIWRTITTRSGVTQTTDLPLVLPSSGASKVHICTWRLPWERMAAPTSCSVGSAGIDCSMDAGDLQWLAFGMDIFDLTIDAFSVLVGIGSTPSSGRGWTRSRILQDRTLWWGLEEAIRAFPKMIEGGTPTLGDLGGMARSLMKWAIQPQVLRPLCNAILGQAGGALEARIAEAAASFLLPNAGVIKGIQLGAFATDVLQRLCQATEPLPNGPWIVQSPGPAVPCTAAATATVLVMDASGSMGGQDKLEAARRAADQLLEFIQMLNSAGASHQVGLVVFDDHIVRSIAPQTDLQVLRDEIASLSPGGGTDLLAPLQEALPLLGAGAGGEHSAILMTDGVDESGHSEGEVLTACAPACGKVRIHTVAFGADAQRDLLERIASQTGGQFHEAGDAMALRASYQSAIQGQHAVIDTGGNIKTNQRTGLGGVSLGGASSQSASTGTPVGIPSAPVGGGAAGLSWARFQAVAPASQPNRQALAASLNWDVGEVALEIRDPRGRIVDATYPGAQLSANPTSVLAVIASPVGGLWQFAVRGTDCPAEGSNYRFTASTVGMVGTAESGSGGGGMAMEMPPQPDDAAVPVVVVLLVLSTGVATILLASRAQARRL
jgi:uncharacterized protein YegL